MTVDGVTALIGIVSAMAGVLFGYLGIKGTIKKDLQSEATQITTVIVKLENISNGITEIKSEVTHIKSDLTEIRERIVKVEESSKAAHRRIDALHREKVASEF